MRQQIAAWPVPTGATVKPETFAEPRPAPASTRSSQAVVIWSADETSKLVPPGAIKPAGASWRASGEHFGQQRLHLLPGPLRRAGVVAQLRFAEVGRVRVGEG